MKKRNHPVPQIPISRIVLNPEQPRQLFEPTEPEELAGSIRELPLDRVYRNPKQPRKTFDRDSLHQLAASIKEHGVIQPIIVEHLPCKQGDYMIVAGERRWRASKLAAQTTIRAIVQEASNHNGRERLILGIVENVQREDMNPIEEAEAYRELKEVHRMEPHEIARQVGRSVAGVLVALQRLQLAPRVIELMRKGKLSTDRKVVSALLEIEDADAQSGVAERAVERRLTIPGIVSYAAQVRVAIGSNRIRRGRKSKSPAMQMAHMRSTQDFDDETPPANWSALQQLGTLPPWQGVVGSADHTCEICDIRKIASPELCGRCPAVEMLVDLVRQTEERRYDR